jgi:hypothetical protein
MAPVLRAVISIEAPAIGRFFWSVTVPLRTAKLLCPNIGSPSPKRKKTAKTARATFDLTKTHGRMTNASHLNSRYEQFLNFWSVLDPVCGGLY